MNKLDVLFIIHHGLKESVARQEARGHEDAKSAPERATSRSRPLLASGFPSTRVHKYKPARPLSPDGPNVSRRSNQTSRWSRICFPVRAQRRKWADINPSYPSGCQVIHPLQWTTNYSAQRTTQYFISVDRQQNRLTISDCD